jgi:hypothetical protein
MEKKHPHSGDSPPAGGNRCRNLPLLDITKHMYYDFSNFNVSAIGLNAQNQIFQNLII